MTWKQRVSTCFGDQDCKFAGHPSEVQNAKQVIADAKNDGATFEDFEKEIVWHIYKNVKAPEILKEHITKQVTVAKNMW